MRSIRGVNNESREDMKSLGSVTPSPQQLTIVRRVRSGSEVIRGAAGSGKTTTAVLKLKLLLLWVLARRRRQESVEPARALVLTFNKTLRGYIQDLVNENTPGGTLEVTVDTFGHWAFEALGRPPVYDGKILEQLAARHSAEIGLSANFIVSEAIYAMGRFLPEQLDEYLTCRRDGRGATPRVERATRQIILERVVRPFNAEKLRLGQVDWNDMAVLMAEKKFDYDVVIVDESQDFSANQLRAIAAQFHPECAATFIIDTAQRIYAGGFTWAEVGLTIRPENSHRLTVNYRNTPEIARVAASLINCVILDDDGTPPLLAAMAGNPIPTVLTGLFNQQVAWCIDYIKANVDLASESVAFLHPKGWFDYLKSTLDDNGLTYVEVTRRSDWPRGEVNIALSTLHSAKGLDFDHAIIIGLSKECLPDGEFDIGDDRFETACRLLSMAIARARKSVILGYKPGEEPAILSRLDADTYSKVEL